MQQRCINKGYKFVSGDNRLLVTINQRTVFLTNL